MSKEREILPLLIRVSSFNDLVESSGGQTALMHYKKDSKDYYYYYLTLGETSVIMFYEDSTPHKRYVGVKNSKIVEKDIPDSDCPVPIIDVSDDLIFEASLEIWYGEKDGEREEKNLS